MATRWLVAGVGLFALTAAAAVAAHGSPLECGELAPFETKCQDDPARLTQHPETTLNVLGFVGTMEITLRQDDGRIIVVCHVAGSGFTTVCGDPVVLGRVQVGHETWLHCKVRGYAGLGVQVPLPALGGWGCRVQM